MLQIRWLHIDWIKIQWILFIILVSLIILLRIFRKILRWKRISQDNIVIESLNGDNIYFRIRLEGGNQVNKNSATESSKIIVFTPFKVKKPKNLNYITYPLITAGYRVEIVSTRNLIKKIQKKGIIYPNELKADDIPIKGFIFFDICTVLLQFKIFRKIILRSILNQSANEPLKLLFIRPIDIKFIKHETLFTEKKARNNFIKLIPFTEGIVLKHYLKKIIAEEKRYQKNDNDDAKINIMPEKFQSVWILSEKQNISQPDVKKWARRIFSNENPNLPNEIIKFNRGGSNFYRQETVLIAEILKALRD